MLNLDLLAIALRNTQPQMTLVIPLGDTANRFYAAADCSRSFYVLGAMGMALPFALGLSMTPGRRVIAIEGDGAILMNLGGLATVARYGTENLGIVILDNGSYASTGGQKTSLKICSSLEMLGRSIGLPHVRTFTEAGEEEDLVMWIAQPGLRFAVVVTAPDSQPAEFVPLAPSTIAARLISSHTES